MKKANSFLRIVALLTVALAIFISHDELYRVPMSVLAINAVVILCGNIFLLFRKKDKENILLWNVCSGGLFVTLSAVPAVHYIQLNWFADVKVIGCVALVAAIAMVLLCVFIIKNFKNEENLVFVVLFCGFLIRVFYVVLAQAHYFQNDVGTLAEGDYGHLGYVYYLFENGKLPDSYTNQFYHPPLHHIICALVMKVCGLFGMTVEVMDEILQCLSLFYGTATLGYMNKIGKKIGLSGKSRCIVIALAAFMPYSVMMAGALNNDGLMVLLVVMFIYYLICWFQEPAVWKIVMMALCMGLAMMTKFSAALIAPAAAVVMLVKVWKNRQDIKRYIGQFAVFALIVFPLGLWHTIRNIIQFDLPMGYVPKLTDDVGQYIGMYGIGQRLFDLTGQLEPLCLQWSNTVADVSYNIPVSLIKFATFGESGFYLNDSVLGIAGTIMFWLVAIVFIMMPVGMGLWIAQKDGQGIWKFFALSGGGTVLFFYVKFCFDYPHICTMSVRYVVPALLLGFLAIGAGLEQNNLSETGHMQKGKKVLTAAVVGFTCLYAITCNIMFLSLGFWL